MIWISGQTQRNKTKWALSSIRLVTLHQRLWFRRGWTKLRKWRRSMAMALEESDWRTTSGGSIEGDKNLATKKVEKLSYFVAQFDVRISDCMATPMPPQEIGEWGRAAEEVLCVAQRQPLTQEASAKLDNNSRCCVALYCARKVDGLL